jgi:hypothetical protein
MPANSDILAWVPPYTPPLDAPYARTVPLAMYRDMVAKWSEAEAVTLELRARLEAHGDDAPGPPGTVTLARLRALENVMDLAREYLFDETEERRGALWAAITEAGRAP